MDFAGQHQVPLHYGAAELEAIVRRSNASADNPFARIALLDSLHTLYSAGAGMPGATTASKADWSRRLD
jgi:hypothetical protein